MQSKVKEFVNVCTKCKTFVDKKIMEPLHFHQVPSKNCGSFHQIVAMDLLGGLHQTISQ